MFAKKRPAKSPSGLVILLLLAVIAAGCASNPPPEEICSASWIKPRTDAALNDFKKSTSGTWETLQKSGERAAENGKLGLIEKASVLLSLSRLVSSFQDSQALADLQTLGTTCNDPDLVRNALVGTLEEYNVPEPYINLLNELDEFVRLLDQAGAEPSR